MKSLPRCGPGITEVSSGPSVRSSRLVLVVMGSISFLLPDPLPPDAQATLSNACFATGYDMAPTPTGLVDPGQPPHRFAEPE